MLFYTLVCRPLLFWFSCKWRYINVCLLLLLLLYAQNPLDTFPRNFPVDGKAANFLPTSRCNGIWEMTRYKRHDGLLRAATATCYRLVVYVADLLRGCRQLVTDLLRRNWCNGFWPIPYNHYHTHTTHIRT